jgi:hypothetical protein
VLGSILIVVSFLISLKKGERKEGSRSIRGNRGLTIGSSTNRDGGHGAPHN